MKVYVWTRQLEFARAFHCASYHLTPRTYYAFQVKKISTRIKLFSKRFV